ncbi:MAG: hypothetical protein GEU79_12685 [Acidimicrobiia bacterium]|nr:hypothetical protein [Acidimicrobiia bacterium]
MTGNRSDRPTAGSHANDAAEAIRRLNHDTLPHEGWPGVESAGDVSSMVAGVALAVSRLPQTCEQLAAWVDGHATRLIHDEGLDQAVEETHAALLLSADAARFLTEHLESAQTLTSHLVGPREGLGAH